MERARSDEANEDKTWTKIESEEAEEGFEHVELDDQLEVLTGSESESESGEWEYDTDSESYPVLRHGAHWDRDKEDDRKVDVPEERSTQDGSEALQARREADMNDMSATEMRKKRAIDAARKAMADWDRRGIDSMESTWRSDSEWKALHERTQKSMVDQRREAMRVEKVVNGSVPSSRRDYAGSGELKGG